MIFYKMQNLQRKEALNQKVEENKPVLELKNTGKKVCQNIWKELFWFYPPCQCALMLKLNIQMFVFQVLAKNVLR